MRRVGVGIGLAFVCGLLVLAQGATAQQRSLTPGAAAKPAQKDAFKWQGPLPSIELGGTICTNTDLPPQRNPYTFRENVVVEAGATLCFWPGAKITTEQEWIGTQRILLTGGTLKIVGDPKDPTILRFGIGGSSPGSSVHIENAIVRTSWFGSGGNIRNVTMINCIVDPLGTMDIVKQRDAASNAVGKVYFENCLFMPKRDWGGPRPDFRYDLREPTDAYLFRKCCFVLRELPRDFLALTRDCDFYGECFFDRFEACQIAVREPLRVSAFVAHAKSRSAVEKYFSTGPGKNSKVKVTFATTPFTGYRTEARAALDKGKQD
jgi:hypothetical protein